MAKAKPVDTEAADGAADPANNVEGDVQGDAQGGAAQTPADGADAPQPQTGGSFMRLDDGTLVPRNDNNAPVGKE